MAMKEPARQVYRSAQGKEIDLDQLRLRNETALAVGNARVNARGDELGPGGKIIRKREDVMAEYHAHPNAVPTKVANAPAATVQPAVAKPVEPAVPLQNFDDEDTEYQ